MNNGMYGESRIHPASDIARKKAIVEQPAGHIALQADAIDKANKISIPYHLFPKDEETKAGDMPPATHNSPNPVEVARLAAEKLAFTTSQNN